VPGLSLISYEPVNESGLYAREFVDDLTDNHWGYTHTISAVGGFTSANFSLKGTREYLDDWFDDGLFRRVVLYNPEAIMVWEGFVNRMTYTVSSLQKSKSLDTMSNRVYLRFSPIDLSTIPPIVSPPETIQVNDIASQIDWGVKSLVIFGGERVRTYVVDPWAANVLKERKDVKTGENVNTMRTEAPFIEVECKGYYDVLRWLPYDCVTSGSILAHQVIIEIMNYFNLVNQGWLSMSPGWIDYSFRNERRCRDELMSCWDVIAQIIGKGGAGGERWVGGLYQNRQMVYKAAEDFGGLYADHFELRRALEDINQFIYDVPMGWEVKPWDMVPDRVLHTTDVNAGGEKSLMYIEQVTYREPYGLTLVGGDDQRLEVFLAQKGLPGL